MIKTGFHFKQRKHRICALFAVASLTALSAESGRTSPETLLVDPDTNAIGGYLPNYTYTSTNNIFAHERPKYLRDKTVLDAAIESCKRDRLRCNPRLLDYVDMLEAARQASPQLTQTALVNAYVNLTVQYDVAESGAKTNLDHRSLLQFIEDNKGVCDESALLKLYSLEKLGFDKHSIYWVAENIFINDKYQGGHSVTAVVLNGKHWIMNLPTPLSPDADFITRVRNASQMETDLAEINISRQSYWSHDREMQGQHLAMTPTYYFNSLEGRYYGIPQSAFPKPHATSRFACP